MTAAGQEWVCPKCGRLGDGWETADGPARVKATPLALPRERTFDPTPDILRERAKEAWEPQARLPKGAPLARPVARTADLPSAEPADAAAAPPVRLPSFERDRAESAPSPDSVERVRPKFALWQQLSLAGLVLLNLALAGVSLFRTSAPPPVLPPPLAVGPAGGPGEEATSATTTPPTGARPLPPEDLPVVRERLRAYLAAATVDDLLGTVRRRAEVEPLVRAAHPDGRLTPRTLRTEPLPEHFTVFDGMAAVTVELDDYTLTPVTLLQENGAWMVDWESTSAWGEVPWDKLAAAPVGKPFVMRVQLTPDDYFNGPFSDAARFACFRIGSLRRDVQAYAYVPRGGQVHRDVIAAMRQMPVLLAVVRLSRPEGDRDGRQFELAEFLTKGWVVREKPPAE